MGWIFNQNKQTLLQNYRFMYCLLGGGSNLLHLQLKKKKKTTTAFAISNTFASLSVQLSENLPYEISVRQKKQQPANYIFSLSRHLSICLQQFVIEKQIIFMYHIKYKYFRCIFVLHVHNTLCVNIM